MLLSPGRDQNIVDPDPHNVYTKCKEHQMGSENNSSAAVDTLKPNYPSDAWSGDIQWMPFFTRANTNSHITKLGKNIDSKVKKSLSTTRSYNVLNNEYLKNFSAASDNTYFYFHCLCYHSFTKKKYPPHNLRVALYC